ncbi:MAG: hypothetical protein HYW86_01175 [Candidatus Roizmanbacteria bacterium]|nr:MAG: hypothetical protein HYW86_01175 [Candidatus Roizmanbacteria bacterium]
MVNTPVAERSTAGIREGVVDIKIPLAEVLGPKNEAELLKLLKSLEIEAKNAKVAAKQEQNKKNNVISINKGEENKGDEKSLKLVESSVKQIIIACNNNPNLIPSNLSEANRHMLGNLMFRLRNVDQINPSTSPYIYEIIQKAMNNQANPLEILSKDDLKFLAAADEYLHRQIQDVMTAAASRAGIDQKTIDHFKTETVPPKVTVDSVINSRFEQEEGSAEWLQRQERGISDYYDLKEPKEVRLLTALYSNEGFGKYIAETIRQTISEVGEADRALLGRTVSKKIEEDMVLLFSKVFRKADESMPHEFWDEIVKEGFYSSIEMTFHNMKNEIIKRGEYMEKLMANLKYNNQPLPTELDDLTKIDFYRRFSVEEYQPQDIKRKDGTIKTDYVKRVVPSPGFQKSKVNEFTRALQVLIDQEADFRKYGHNVRALFYKPGGEGGFWNSLAQYANEFPAVDLDSMTFLPDSDIFMSAARLYTKYLEEDFAVKDWVHDANMFANGFQSTRTTIEENILATLKRQYGKDIKTEEWRLRRAMNMGVAIARGILMTEPEIAAWALPSMKRAKGMAPTFVSYYLNDNTALSTLNPLHHFLRWQADVILQHNVAFFPVDGPTPKFTEKADHTKLWDLAEKYRETFYDGGNVLSKETLGRRIFLEVLPNFGKVGSIFTRAGWRNENAIDGWLVHDGNKTKLDYLKSWKSLENIGFEPLYSFATAIDDNLKSALTNPESMLDMEAIEKGVEEEITKGKYQRREKDQKIEEAVEAKKKEITEKIAEREKIFKYIFNKYILDPSQRHLDTLNLDVPDPAYEAEVAKQRVIAEQTVDGKIKQGDQFVKDDRENEIIKETYSRILYKGLAGVLRDRMPAKFLRIDRDRNSVDGESRWKKVRNALIGKTGWPAKGVNAMQEMAIPYDQAMKDLALVETQLRVHTSEKMKKHLEQYTNNPLSYELHSAKIYDYILDDRTIEEVLNENLGDETEITAAEKTARIKRAKDVLRLTNELYLHNENFKEVEGIKLNGQPVHKSFLDTFADQMMDKSKHFPFALATDEVDTYFLAYRAAGPSIIRRALGDTSQVEQVVLKETINYLGLFSNLAITPSDENFHKLGAPLKKIWDTMNSIHGTEIANELVHHLAALAPAYFKTDTDARLLWMKLARVGTYKSVAAKIAGRKLGIWEWDVEKGDKWAMTLSDLGIQPKEPYQSGKAPYKKEDVKIRIPFTNRKIKIGEKKTLRKPDFKYSIKKFREDFGATGKHIAAELFMKWGPILIFFLLYQFITKAFKEATGEGQKG